MIKVSLLSDTHSFMERRILELCRDSDEIWHAGDIGDLEVTDQLQKIARVRAVYGNIDSHDIRRTWPEHSRFTVEAMDVWITHIGGYPGRYSPNVKPLIYDNPPDLFISGHSHILKVIHDKKLDLLHMNPGAIGLQGFHRVRTLLRFKVHGNRIKDLEVVEMKR